MTADGTDLLATREEALTWLHAAGLLPGDAVIGNSEHGALVRLRDALREVIDARAAGMAAPDAAARLSRALADGRLVVTVSPAGQAVLASSARASYSNMVAAIAIAVAAAWLPGLVRGPRELPGNALGVVLAVLARELATS